MAKDNLDILIRANTRQFERALKRNEKVIRKWGMNAQREFKRTNRAANKFNRQMRTVAKRMVGLGTIYFAAKFLKGIIETNDAIIEMNNRLKLVTDTEQDLIKTRKAVYDISMKTRSALSENVKFYAKLKLATENMNFTDKQRLRVVETINKQVQIGGSTTTEANAGLIQFAQGLASGTLRGDELRSVLEQLQGVSVGLIEGFRKMRQDGDIDINVTRGNIRALAAEGKLTSDLLIKATLKQADATDKAFEKVKVGASAAGVNIATEWTEAVEAFDQMTGIGDAWLAVLGLVEDQIRNIRQLMEGNTPIETFAQGWSTDRPALESRLQNLERDLAVGDLNLQAGQQVGLTGAQRNAIEDEIERINSIIQGKADMDAKWNPILDERSRKRAEQRNQEDRVADASVKLQGEASVYRDEGRSPTAIYEERMAKLREVNAHEGAVSAANYHALIKKYAKERLEAQNKINTGMMTEVKRYDELTPRLEQYEKKIAEIQAKVQTGHLTPEIAEVLKRQAKAAYDDSQLIEETVEKYKTLGRTTVEVSNEMQTAMEGMESKMEDTILSMIEGTLSAKDAFRSMATEIIKEFIRITVARKIAQAGAQILGAAFSGFGGGATGGGGGGAPSGTWEAGRGYVRGYASGGMVRKGTPIRVGENGEEVFIPSTGGRVMSSGQSKEALSGTASKAVVVHQSLNFSVGVQQTVRAEIRQLMPQIADAAGNAVIDRRKRGGAMASAFGG